MRRSRNDPDGGMVVEMSAHPRMSRFPCARWPRFLIRFGALSLVLYGCGAKLPQKSSKEYAEAVSAFYIGLGALQVGDDIHADSELSKLTAIVPGEPAGWANWGVLA